ncbi:hypothetical protein M3090_12450 [Bacteroides sp. ET71]|uniref:hypothetical protein n=1 Tax=Bacteroides sp. ET71 TaxID=2939421 RepID=UPI0020123701|nr:hypothetical protein [Bacteroides sp. ET71]MCL1617199.1 hypothetical protein [Bacteroides sp. ET71]
MRKLLLLLLFVSMLLISCGSREQEPSFSRENAMQKFLNMSPERGAYFYAQNRKTYSFLDSFYRDSIFPAIAACNYKELKNINASLRSTPLEGVMEAYFQGVRNEYLQDIQAEIVNYTVLQKRLFEDEIFPLIEFELDSMLTADIENLIDEYAGGFLNYRKLEFFVGKDRSKFEKLWKENIRPQSYNEHLNKYVQAYLDSICTFQKEYFHTVTGRNVEKELNMDVSQISINISTNILNQVDSFTSGEKIAMTTELIKDYAAPIAVGIVTGGVGAILYEIGNTTYDVYTIYKDIENQVVEPEELLLSVCVEEMSHNIGTAYLQKMKQDVLSRIDSSNKVLFNLIALAL